MLNKRKRVYFLIIFLLITGTGIFQNLSTQLCTDERYSFDIGSGAIKTKAALVNSCKEVIVKDLGEYVVHNEFFNCLQKDSTISESCIIKSMHAVDKIEQHFGIKCGINKCAGIATAWARQATNAHVILEDFQARGIYSEIISQEVEGESGFLAARASAEVKKVDEKKAIIWDIGGASFQLSTIDDNGKIFVYNGLHGVHSFENYLRDRYEVYQHDQFPYFGGTQLENAIDYAANEIGKKILENPLLAKRLANPKIKVFAMGRPMYWGLKMDMELPSVISTEKLRELAALFIDKTPEEIKKSTKLPDHFVRSAQSSIILIYGIMKGAGIKEIEIIDATLNDYILTEPKFWAKEKHK